MRILFSSDFHANRPALDLFAESLAVGPYDPAICGGRTSPDAAKEAIEKSGYTVSDKGSASTLIALGIGVALAYMLASSAGIFNAFPGRRPRPWSPYGRHRSWSRRFYAKHFPVPLFLGFGHTAKNYYIYDKF